MHRRALFRTIYAASSVEASYVEVVAQFRPDPGLAEDLAAITGCSDDDASMTNPPGVVGRGWLRERRLGSANLDGDYVDVGHSRTIAGLRPLFLPAALSLGLPDFDAAALRIHAPREFTQAISRHLYGHETAAGQLVSGVAFESRHGDDLRLWAVLERDADVGWGRSHLLHDCHDEEIDLDSEAFRRALDLHRLVVQRADQGSSSGPSRSSGICSTWRAISRVRWSPPPSPSANCTMPGTRRRGPTAAA